MPTGRRRAIRIGCSGWNYKSWKDEVYGGRPAREWLELYARRFDTVEVNNTFYRLPSRDAGAEFIVMFLPFKSQVYWPLLERSLTPDDLHHALAFYLEGNGRPIDVAAMRRNRLAQNAMLRDLCESAHIRFLDMTPALERRVESGDNVYFPDESHLNELGHAIVAESLASFLRE